MMTATRAEKRQTTAASTAPGILIVDDEPAIRQLLELGLQMHGFQVWLASSGAEAVQLYQLHGSAIAVVLLDVLMPGLDGPQTLHALEQIAPNVRCIFMSGNLGKYREQDLLGLGARGVVAKPFVLENLAERLRQLAGAA